MRTVELDTLPGYHPLATERPDDAQATVHGLADTAATASQGGIILGSEVGLGLDEIGGQEYQGRQGCAEYVGGLVMQLEGTGQDVLACDNLRSTNLTDLFAREHGVAIEQLTNGLSIVRMVVQVSPQREAHLAYQITYGPSSDTYSFWELVLSGHGYVNLSCASGQRWFATPLSGSGNIASMPGVERALGADVEMLAATARPTHSG